MGPDASATKRAVLEKLLNESMVLVTVDTRDERVDVPPRLRNDPQLRLNLSYRFQNPMEIDDWGVRATLTFDGTPYTCRLPWDRMYSFVSHSTGQPFIFPADVPEELANQLEPIPQEEEPEKRPQFAVVRGEGTDDTKPESPDPKDSPTDDKPRNRSHLRVVK